MKYFPYKKYVFQSKLSIQELRHRLQEKLAEPKLFSNYPTNTGKVFEGNLRESVFKITRIIDYRNSFLPVITGVFEVALSGTKVEVTMRLGRFTLIFMCFWLGVVGLVVLFMFGALILGFDKSSGEKFDPAALIPFFLLIFGYLLFVLPFSYEAKKAKKVLCELFEAE